MLPWIWASFMIHDDPSSARVVHPYLIGDELVGDGIPTRFVIDIAGEDVMTAAAMAPAAFRRIHDLVLPERQAAADQEQQRNREALARHPEARVNRHHEQFRSTWWQLSWRRPTMIAALFRLPRDIALGAHASRAPPARVTFVSSEIHLSNGTFVSGLADDYSFGACGTLLQPHAPPGGYARGQVGGRHMVRVTSCSTAPSDWIRLDSVGVRPETLSL